MAKKPVYVVIICCDGDIDIACFWDAKEAAEFSMKNREVIRERGEDYSNWVVMRDSDLEVAS